MVADSPSQCAATVYVSDVLLTRLKQLPFDEATHLLPENLLAASALPEHRRSIADHLRSDFAHQRAILCRVLRHGVIFSDQVLAAMSQARREAVLPEDRRTLAYWNGVNVIRGLTAVPSPWLIAYQMTALGVNSGERVAILGFGTGYTTLVASLLVEHEGAVYAIDNDPELIDAGRELLRRLNIRNVLLELGDAFDLEAPFPCDVVCATLASETVPECWHKVTNDGGRIGAFLPTRMCVPERMPETSIGEPIRPSRFSQSFAVFGKGNQPNKAFRCLTEVMNGSFRSSPVDARVANDFAGFATEETELLQRLGLTW